MDKPLSTEVKEQNIPTWKEVDRVGLMTRQARRGTLINAIIETSESGKAILVSGVSGSYLRSTLYAIAKGVGLKAHIIRKGDNFVAWCEKPTPEPQP